MLPLIVLICPWTQRLEELSCTSGLLWPSLCTCSVCSQSSEPNRHGVARPVGAWQPNNGVMSFFFFYSPTEDDVYVIDFSPTLLSTVFPLQCAKQDWVQAWSMHCFSFSITLEWAEDTKGYTGEVWQGWKQSGAPSRPIHEFAWMFMWEKFNKFIMCVSNNFIILVVSWELIYAHYKSLVFCPSGNLPSMPLLVLCNLTFTILY